MYNMTSLYVHPTVLSPLGAIRSLCVLLDHNLIDSRADTSHTLLESRDLFVAVEIIGPRFEAFLIVSNTD